MPRLSLCFRFPTRLRRRARRRRMATLLSLFVLVLLLLLPLHIIYKPPRLLIRYFRSRWPGVLWEVDTPLRIMALTIDDAPSEHTQEILGVLKMYDATATFFVIGGQVQGREEVLADIVRSGHELGNHAMHDEASRSLSDEKLAEEMGAVRDMIGAAYREAERDPPPQYFRPGSGFFSDRLRRLVAKLGYRLVLGSVYPHDPQIPYPWVNSRHVLSMAHPGAIIICHDRRRWTAPMLRTVLKQLKKDRWRVMSVSSMLKIAQAYDEPGGMVLED